MGNLLEILALACVLELLGRACEFVFLLSYQVILLSNRLGTLWSWCPLDVLHSPRILESRVFVFQIEIIICVPVLLHKGVVRIDEAIFISVLGRKVLLKCNILGSEWARLPRHANCSTGTKKWLRALASSAGWFLLHGIQFLTALVHLRQGMKPPETWYVNVRFLNQEQDGCRGRKAGGAGLWEEALCLWNLFLGPPW